VPAEKLNLSETDTTLAINLSEQMVFKFASMIYLTVV
jgi:hypothetical protein